MPFYFSNLILQFALFKNLSNAGTQTLPDNLKQLPLMYSCSLRIKLI